MRIPLRKPVSMLLAILLVLSIFTVIPAAAATITTDTLTSTLIGQGSSYGDWSGVTSSSAAVYAGNTAKGTGTHADTIQLRTTGNNSGIVTTTSGGYAVKVTVEWSPGMNSDRTLNVFGKNTAYSGAGELYSSTSQGDSLGSVSYDSSDRDQTTTELSISGRYQYIGLRSNGSSLNLSQIAIQWSDEAPAAPTGYTVTWKNGSSTVLETDTNVAEGASPEYNGSTPQWSSTAQYTYTFDGWTTEADGTTVYNESNPLPGVTGNVTYYAHYSRTVRTYTVTWMNEDGSETLETDENVPYGDPAVFNGTIPTKPDGDEFTFTFDGWVSNGTKYAADALPAVSGNVTYTVAYKAGSKYPNTDMLDRPFTGVTGNSYSGWEDKSGSSTSAVYEGNSAGGNNSIQLRSGTSSGSNVHSGIVSASTGGRVTRVAVTWNNTDSNKDGSGNGKALSIYGNTAAYNSVEDLYSDDTRGTLIGTLSYDENALTTVCTITGNYDYIGLRSANGAIYLDAIYITWVSGHAYDVTWQNYDGTQLEKDAELEVGSIPAYDSATPTKASDVQYDYTFIGWRDAETDEYFDKDEEFPGVDHDVTYVAQYSSTLRKYTVTWYDEDGETELATNDVEYGTVPTFSGAHPTKDSDGTYNYYLSGWSPTPTAVTGPASYTAVFSPTPIAGYTVTWENWDGTVLETDEGVQSGTRAHYNGVSAPQKASDTYYIYEFYGWGIWNAETGQIEIGNRFLNDNPPYVTGDITFRAVYSAKPTAAYRSGRIDRTNDNETYTLTGKYYKKIDGTVGSIDGTDMAFSERNILKDNKLYLGDHAVADMTLPADAVFAHTVFVTGEGTEDDPYVFYPNFIYSQNADKVAEASDTDKSIIHPGDGFKGMSKVRIGIDYLRYLQYVDRDDLECNHGTNGFMGVSKTDYGNRYENANAMPYPFIGEPVLYYVGELKSAHNFTERQIIDNTFGDIVAKQMYTVTWIDGNGKELRTNQIYEGEQPRYGTIADAIPTKTADIDTTYTFNGSWMDAETSDVYDESDLPVMTGDVTYIAQFDDDSKLFVGHSLTLDGDIGLNFFLNVTADQITTGDGVVVNFERTVSGTVKRDSFKLKTGEYIDISGKRYYKATIWLPAAEMTYNIHATATINGELQTETDDYTVRSYGDVILDSESDFSKAYIAEYGQTKYNKLTDLVKAMLNYGAKAQTAFNRTEVPLADKDIVFSPGEVNFAEVEDPSDMSDGVAAYGLEYEVSSVVFLNQTTLRHYYKLKNGPVSEDVKQKAAESGFVYGEKSGRVYFEKQNIGAKEIDTVYNLSFDGVKTYGYSVLQFAKSIWSSNTAIAEAVYWYNYYADIYFAE